MNILAAIQTNHNGDPRALVNLLLVIAIVVCVALAVLKLLNVVVAPRVSWVALLIVAAVLFAVWYVW